MSYNRELDPQGLGHQFIKQGLLKIKEAQVQVLRELHKDDGDRPAEVKNKNFGSDVVKQLQGFSKNKTYIEPKAQKTQNMVSEFMVNEVSQINDTLKNSHEVQIYKEIVQRAEAKVKQCQQNEEKALNKAQNAYSNAIVSEKKYIALKRQFEKINKQRERLFNDVKKIQSKQLASLKNAGKNETKIPGRIIQEMISIVRCFKELSEKVNQHKCSNSGFSDQKDSLNKNYVSPNTLLISTLQVQRNIDDHINKVINYFKSFEISGSVLNKLEDNCSMVLENENNNFLSNSFREEFLLLDQQMQINSNKTNECPEASSSSYESKLKELVSENEQLREIKRQFIELKNKTNDKSEKTSISSAFEYGKGKNSSNKQINQDINRLQFLEDKFLELQKENEKLIEKLRDFQIKQKQNLKKIRNLQNDLQEKIRRNSRTIYINQFCQTQQLCSQIENLQMTFGSAEKGKNFRNNNQVIENQLQYSQQFYSPQPLRQQQERRHSLTPKPTSQPLSPYKPVALEHPQSPPQGPHWIPVPPGGPVYQLHPYQQFRGHQYMFGNQVRYH